MPVKLRKILKVLSKQYGYYEVRKGRGDHSVWKNHEGRVITIVMKNEIKQGTYLAILREAKIDRKEFETYF